MKRVAIIGNAGGGKSTLGRRLSLHCGLPYSSVDQLQFLPGWVAVDEIDLNGQLDELVAQDAWIIDGWGPWPSIERRLRAADTIIFIDLPLWVHFWLAAERQIEIARGGERSDPIEGCDQLQITKRLFETIWRVDRESLPRLRGLVDACSKQATLIRIASLQELDDAAERFA